MTIAKFTQIGGEVWSKPAVTNAKLTQINAEVWVKPANTNAKFTQIGVEVWVSLIAPPSSAVRPAFLMVIT